MYFFSLALATGQTCFAAGECREGQHVEGDPAADELQCLENCQRSPDCHWFTFFPQLGYCQLLSDCPVLDNEFCSDCLSGQSSCSAPEPVCFVPGECKGSVDHVEGASSQETCLEVCQSLDSCRWFTYHAPSSACVLYHNCDEISTDCNECVSGESRCQLSTTTDVPPTSTTPAGHYVYLTGGSSSNEGNVFAYNPLMNVLGPVCDDFWELYDAQVVCRQLGFDGAELATGGSYFGSVPSNFSYDNVNCVGDEATLDDCTWIGYDDCSSSEGAGVVCTMASTTTEATTPEPPDHYVQLVGGSNPNEGNVYAQNPVTGIYGPVCDDGFDLTAANVVCKQLGFSGASAFHTESFYGNVDHIFSYDDISCESNDGTLDDCNHSNFENCGPNEAAGVNCYKIELIGGSNATEGNVYATNPNTNIHGPICDDNWSHYEADVICRMLGFRRSLQVTHHSHFGPVPEVFAFDDVICHFGDPSLFSCDFSDEDNCATDEGAGVVCEP